MDLLGKFFKLFNVLNLSSEQFVISDKQMRYFSASYSSKKRCMEGVGRDEAHVFWVPEGGLRSAVQLFQQERCP